MRSDLFATLAGCIYPVIYQRMRMMDSIERRYRPTANQRLWFHRHKLMNKHLSLRQYTCTAILVFYEYNMISLVDVSDVFGCEV